ncbi:thioredoxin family protein [Noviherbaspirillum saxi]|uniref:Thioredoxin n=1 Tax=Noviherbaspirillum saxi TaxID=2320863 RepID=A0A3A3FWB6_9BURK|nr:thioredoxin family protein [Noviherbaspirillum saxi]RJF98441.1 thioredoxin [Noviherbaspirillum saxi]
MSWTGFILDNHNRAQLAQWLDQDDWVIVCLCAAWCDTCQSYRASFEKLAARHPDKRFAWIDIEDQSDFIGDIDVENFPTLLMQHGDTVAFFGTVLPDLKLADRLIHAQAEKTTAELQSESQASSERSEWQRICNLRVLLQQAAA